MNPRLITVRERVITSPRPDKGKGRKQFLSHKRGKAARRGPVELCPSMERHSSPSVITLEGARRLNNLILLSSPPSLSC